MESQKICINNDCRVDSEINRLHSDFSRDYFETGRVEKVNLSRTIAHIPVSPIYKYRLFLDEVMIHSPPAKPLQPLIPLPNGGGGERLRINFHLAVKKEFVLGNLRLAFNVVRYMIIADITCVKCDVIIPPAPPCQGGTA